MINKMSQPKGNIKETSVPIYCTKCQSSTHLITNSEQSYCECCVRREYWQCIEKLLIEIE